MYLTIEGPPERVFRIGSLGEGPTEKVCRRISIREDPLERVVRQRGLSVKIRWKRSVGEGPTEKMTAGKEGLLQKNHGFDTM